jgi:hypothetical protein
MFLENLSKKIILLKSDKNNGYCTWIPMYIYDSTSLNSSQNEKCFTQKVVEEIKTHILCSITLLPQMAI